MKKHFRRKLPLMVLVFLAAFALMSGLVFTLWNGILTPVLHVGAVTLLQAAGILVLARILFGGRGRRHMGMRGCYQRHMAAQAS